MKKGRILHFSYLTNLSCSVSNVNATSYLILDGILPPVGYIQLGPGGTWEASGFGHLREVYQVLQPWGRSWSGVFPFPSKLTCARLNAPRAGCTPAGQLWRWPSVCRGNDDVQMAKAFLLHSHWLCSAKQDVIKLIKPEITSCNYYLIIKLQR